jgi:hypothetical protein
VTPLQFAKAECANHQADGSCLGATFDEQLRPTGCTPKAHCLLAVGKRCPYFEACVLPMAEFVTDPKRAAALHTACVAYRRMTGQPVAPERKCPDCGGAVRKKHRYCPDCAAKRRKDTLRTAQRERRQTAVGLSTVIPKKAAVSLGKSGAFSPSTQNPYQDSHHPQTGVISPPTQEGSP